MDASCLTSSSNGVFSYVFNHIAGEDESARTGSGYWNAFPNGMWVTDLPTNNYEPLEVSRAAQVVAKKNEQEKELKEKIAALNQLEAQWDDQEIKIQKSVVKDEREKEKPGEQLQEITGQRTGLDIKLFKADDYFKPQSSLFDNFLQNKEFADQSPGFNNSKDNEADDYFEPQPSPFDDFVPIKEHGELKGSEMKLFKADDYFEPQPSPFDDSVPISERGELKGSEIKLFKAEDYFDPQPSVFDYLFNNAGSHRY